MSVKNKKKNKKVEDPGPGLLLQQARNRKELSLGDVSSRLRLGKDVIDALENDNFDKLPAPIFVRGYIKSYASFVGIDVQQIIDRYNQKVGEVDSSISLGTAHVTPPSKSAIKERKKKWAPVIAVGVLVLFLLVFWMFDDSDEPAHTQVASSPMDNVPAENSLNPTLEPGMNKQLSDEAKTEQQQNEAVPVETVPEPVVETQAEPGINTNTTVSATESDAAGDNVDQEATQPELDQLVLVFNGDSWVDVSDATGKRLIYRMLKSGQQRSVAGRPPFKMTLGNAPEINLTRNGETVDLTPYTRGKVAKFRLGNINE